MVKPGSDTKPFLATSLPVVGYAVSASPESFKVSVGGVNMMLEILNGILPVMVAPLVEVKSTSKWALPWPVVLATTAKLQVLAVRVTEVSLGERLVASPQVMVYPVSVA